MLPGVGNAIRAALGIAPAPTGTAKKAVFFGTYRTLLQVIGAMIQLRAARPIKTRRRGVSAKNFYARAKGRFFCGHRRAAARGPNSYAEHDALVRTFGRVNADRYKGARRGAYPEAMHEFQRTLHA